MGSITTAEKLQLPAHIAARFNVQANSDLTEGTGAGFPVISYKGKVWAVSKSGERTVLLNSEGDPRASIDVVILKANPKLSKIYYAKGFEEGTSEKPDCYSNDSITPAADAQNKQAEKCAICPKNAWGSRMSENGGKGKACSDSRRLAVADPADIENVMLLRVPAASLKPLGTFARELEKRNVPYQAMVTKIGFNPEVAHPEFTFKPLSWLTEEQADMVAELQDSDTVNDILAKGGHDGPAEPAPAPAAPVDDFLPAADAIAEAPKATKPKATKPKPAPVAEPEPEVEAPQEAATVLDDANASLDDLLKAFDNL